MKFVHVTDTHLVAPRRTLCGLDPAKRLRTAIDRINQTDADADFVVVTGDLSYHGLEPAYLDLRDALLTLSMPFHLLIGNHDDRESFNRIFPNTPRDDDGFVQYVVETGTGAFVMLDTVVEGKSHGMLCDRRLGWLETQLARYRSLPVFLFMHHPPFAVGLRSLDTNALRETSKLGEILKVHGNVRHIFYGHVHRPIAGSWLGIPATTLPGTNHQVALNLGHEQQLLGSHEPSAYGVCLIDDETVVVHMRYFLDDSPRFLLSDPRSKDAMHPSDLPALPKKYLGHF